MRKARRVSNAHQERTLISLNSNSSLRRPLGPRQPPPRVASITGATKKSTVSSGKAEATERILSHHAHLQVLEVPQTPTRIIASRISQQTSVAKQLSGKPPRTRQRAAVLADLTGFARNVDLGAHGVGRPARHGADKKDRGKENTRNRTTVHKVNKENEGLSSPVHASRKDVRVPNKLSGATPLSPKTPAKEQDTSAISVSLAANLSGATMVTKGSVRDRMMDWERERERLREMVMLGDMGDNASTILTRTSAGSDSSPDDDSEVEAEVVAEVASAQAKCKTPVEDETCKEASISVKTRRPTTSQTATTISSSSSKFERSQIEVAKIAVRASAQILSSRNESITALGVSQSSEKRPREEKNDLVTDTGLPKEVNRNLNCESGFSSLKHSVKASIGKYFLKPLYLLLLDPAS